MSVKLPDLVIASGQTASNAYEAGVLDLVGDLSILAPATLPETVEPQGTLVDSPSAGDWFTLPGGIVFAAGQISRVSQELIRTLRGFRLLSATAVGAERRFKVSAGDDAI